MYSFYQKEPIIEKDPIINKMRLDVFQAIDDIAKESFNHEPVQNFCSQIKFVSFEDAVKELIAMKNNG